MPLYDYQCRACSKVAEVRHGFREPYQGTCPECGSADLARVFNAAGIVFKGSGFYVTDSRKASGSESAASSSGAAASSSSAAADSSSSGSSESSSPSAGSESSSPTAPAASSPPAPKKTEASAA